jgi:hypothetical protein
MGWFKELQTRVPGAGGGIPACGAKPPIRVWCLQVNSGQFAPPPPAEVVVLPGGKRMVATVDGAFSQGGEAAVARQLKYATHTVNTRGKNAGVTAFTVRVVHAEGQALSASAVQVMDSSGHELAAARLVDS